MNLVLFIYPFETVLSQRKNLFLLSGVLTYVRTSNNTLVPMVLMLVSGSLNLLKTYFYCQSLVHTYVLLRM